MKSKYSYSKNTRQTKKNVPPKPLPLNAPTQAKASGLAYSFSVMLLLAMSLVVSVVLAMAGLNTEAHREKDWYRYINAILPQFCLFFIAVLYFSWLNRPVRQAIKEQKCHPKYFLLAVLLQIGLLSLGELNNLFLTFLKRFGYQDSPITVPSLDGFGFIGVLFCVALLPAIFEEVFFRGILLKGLRVFGTTGAVLLCGGLFALYHQNPVQTVYQFVCGAAFAYMVIKAGSIFPTMLAHFINNALIIVLTKCGVESFPTSVYIPYLIITSLCLIGSLCYLFFCDKTDGNTGGKEMPIAEKNAERKRFFVCVLVGITVFVVNWFSALLAGF